MRFLDGHADDVTALAFSHDGSLLATGSWDGIVQIWDTMQSRVRVRFTAPNLRVATLSFSHDDALLAVGFIPMRLADVFNHGYGTLACIPMKPLPDSVETLDTADTWFAHVGGVRSAAFLPDGTLLTAGLDERRASSIAFWNPADRKIAMDLGQFPVTLQRLAVRQDGSAFAVAFAGMSSGVPIWQRDARGRYPRRLPITARHPSERCRALAFSPDGATLVGGFDGGRLAWWRDAQLIAWDAAHTGPVEALAFSPSGDELLSVSVDGVIHGWEPQNRTLRRRFDWQIGDIRCLTFAPDGLTAVAGGSGVAVIWDIDG